MNRRQLIGGALSALAATAAAPALAKSKRRSSAPTRSPRPRARPQNVVTVRGRYAIGLLILVTLEDGSERYCQVIGTDGSNSICQLS